jgi:hypothetical protein
MKNTFIYVWDKLPLLSDMQKKEGELVISTTSYSPPYALNIGHNLQ